MALNDSFFDEFAGELWYIRLVLPSSVWPIPGAAESTSYEEPDLLLKSGAPFPFFFVGFW